jgi:hypothetical protein
MEIAATKNCSNYGSLLAAANLLSPSLNQLNGCEGQAPKFRFDLELLHSFNI